MHPRTLDRHLESYNINFRQLSNDTLFALACQLLKNTTLDIEQISTTLGYARTSSFSRAFKRWSGKTPNLWRKVVRRIGNISDPM
jgi:AraC-like DNA-binding protein